MARRQNAVQNRNLIIANKLFDNCAKFKYLGKTVTNQIFIHEEISSKI